MVLSAVAWNVETPPQKLVSSPQNFLLIAAIDGDDFHISQVKE